MLAGRGALDAKQPSRSALQEQYQPPSLEAMIDGQAPAADWVISPEDLTICKDEDGVDILLGKGGFGSVGAPCLTLFLTN